MAYVARSDIETFLNITLNTNGQNTVDAIIPAIEAFVDDYTNRTWTKASGDNIIETYDGGQTLYLPKITPIASVQSIVIDGTTLSTDDYYVYEDYIRLAEKASSGYRNVVITYRTSANSAPADLKHSIVRWVSEIFKSQDSGGKTVSRVTMGPMTIDYLTKDGIPAYVEKVLNKYRIINI
jgi:hypothetical protein